jgi:membrane complex biogenesis BtpA family protein
MLDRNRKSLIGMIHVGALPGTPRCTRPLESVVRQAGAESGQLAAAGFDALLIENMHDVPYLNGAVGPEIVAGMTAVGLAVRGTASLPLGVQILAGANREALAVAQACGAEFVRVENFTYAHVADEGLMPVASAGPLLRYRRQIGAEQVRIFADVKKKHAAHAVTADVSLPEAARTTEFFGADGVVVTGIATGRPTDPADVQTVKEVVSIPVIVGSGVTPENLPELWPHADAFIVGSHLKRDGRWFNELDAGRVGRFMQAAGRLR